MKSIYYLILFVIGIATILSSFVYSYFNSGYLAYCLIADIVICILSALCYVKYSDLFQQEAFEKTKEQWEQDKQLFISKLKNNEST